MARAIIWPIAQPVETAAPPLAALKDAAGFAAALGPELTRLFGVRAAARPTDEDCAVATHLVARLRLPPREPGGPPATLALLLALTDIAWLLDIIFGGTPASARCTLPALPPSSASWSTLTRFLADATGRALAATGQRPEGPAHLPSRAAPLGMRARHNISSGWKSMVLPRYLASCWKAGSRGQRRRRRPIPNSGATEPTHGRWIWHCRSRCGWRKRVCP